MTEIKHDEDLLEQLYWEFDNARKKGEERLKFKALLRSYATKMAAKSLSTTQTDDTTQSHVPKISQSTLNTRPVWEHHAEKFVQWKHRLSYNDSYVGEPAGLFKQVAFALDRLIGQDIETARVEALNILTSFRDDDNNTIFDFDESQWWVKELDEIRRFPDTTAFTDDMRRAVAVVHHLLRLIVNLKEHLDDNNS